MKVFSRGRASAALALAAAVSLIAGCSSDDSSTGEASEVSASASATTINVSAAASLKKAFTDLASVYEKQHAGSKVTLSFAGSATLATQINQGAPVDVFASADEKNMTKVGTHAADPQVFATNTLVIVTAPGNPKKINSLKDLENSDIKTALCAAAQPCGNASLEVEKNAGVSITPVSEEPSVTAVLTKVTTGQVDAGLVYVTDAKSAGDKVATVSDPVFSTVVNKYPISVISGSSNQATGKEFVNLVMSTEGQSVLKELGFGAP